MKRQNRILAGTALATLMMTASAGFAFAVPNVVPLRVSQPLVYAQADADEVTEPKKKKRKAEQRKESHEKTVEDSGATKKQQAQAKRKYGAGQENAGADDSRQEKASKKQAVKKQRPADETAQQAAEPRQAKAAKAKQAKAEQAAAKKQAAQVAVKNKQQSAAAKALPVAALAQAPTEEPRLSDEEQGMAASRKLAQAEEQEGGEAPAEEQPIRKKRKAEQAPSEQVAPQPEEAAPEAQPEEAAPEPQAEEAAPEPQPDQAAPAQEPQREEAPAELPQEAAPAEEPQPKQAAPAEEPQREEAAPAEESRPRKARPAQEEAAPAEQRKRRKQAAEEQPGEAAPAEQPAEAEPEAPAGRPAEAESPPEGAPEQPAEASPEGEAAPAEAAPAEPLQPAEAEAAPDDGKAAPVLDSQKRRPRGEGAGGRRDRGKRPAGEGTEASAPEPEAAPAGPPPADDRAAQEAAQPKAIEPVTAERGTRRRDRAPDDGEPRRRQRPEGSRVLREVGDRVVIQFGNQVIVESNDRPRIARGAREVYYEDLPRGRTREIIVRRDGTQVITVRNAYGDVIRRSRIAPDGREYVLAYVDDGYYDRVRDWRDPGDDLPPMRLGVPIEEYIFDATTAVEPEAYYEFLEQPPVERVERLYSVDEVKRSARIRDKTRRIDMDTLTFEFGSASIPEDQIAKLDGVAQAMEKILAKNPAETFLIEGHTDAVGSDLANLALSDRRAEAVADALTNVFAIPPENLATQGYGEQYLKVRTQAPERENRRVAIRRITPLVAPVASAQ